MSYILNKIATRCRLNMALAVLLVMGSACVDQIPLDENYQSSKIVVNSIFSTQDDTLDVYVTETRHVYGLDKDFVNVDNAKLSLYNGHEFVADLTLNHDVRPSSTEYYSESSSSGSRFSLGGFQMDEGATYSIKVEHPTMGIAEAEVSVPVPVKIKTIELKKEQVMEYESLIDVLVAYVTFDDPADVDNYYQVIGGYTEVAERLRNRDTYDYTTGNYIREYSDTLLVSRSDHPSSYEQVDPMIKPNEDDMFNYSENIFQIFNDELINGKTYVLRYVVDRYFNDEDDFSHLDADAGEYYKVNINLRSIPKELYLYYTSAEAFYWNDGNPFSEPIQVYSNVDNGVGVFGAFSSSEKELLKGNYIPDEKVYMSRSVYYNNYHKDNNYYGDKGDAGGIESY